MNKRSEITADELEVALRSLAFLIQAYGSKYWPIFERLDNELEQIRARQKKLASMLDF